MIPTITHTLQSKICVVIAIFAISLIFIMIHHLCIVSGSNNKKQRTRRVFDGLQTQRAQGGHGWKGGCVGKQYGHRSMESPRVKNYLRALRNGQVANHGRPKKEKPKKGEKRIAIKTLCADMNIEQKIDFIETVEAQIKETGRPDDIKWVEAGRETWGDRIFDEAYPDKVAKGNFKRIVSKWWERKRLIKCLWIAGYGENKNFLRGRAPSNPYEPIIKQQLIKMALLRIKVGPMLTTHVAAMISKANGMIVRVNRKKDNKIKSMIYEDMFDDIDDICKQSEIENKNGPIFSLTDNWRKKFRSRQNIKYGADNKTECDLFGLLTNLEPSLEFCWSIRKIFNIKAGEGRILNCDQTMYYRLYQPKYTYSFK